jgi:ribose-phosphate pyrophosphokinase
VACKKRGAKDIYACVSHGVFSHGSAAKIAQSPIKELVLTDTIEHRFEPLAPCCKVVSVASLFADAIISIHRRESVSRLFNYNVSEVDEESIRRESGPKGWSNT